MLHLQQSLPTLKSYRVWLPLIFLLNGCLAAPIKPSPHKMDEIRTILVVPVEPPPLEVVPDLIKSRFPVYNQYQYQSIQSCLYLEKSVYKSPGGVLISGMVSKDEVIPIADTRQTPVSMEKIASLKPGLSVQENCWSPTFTLAQQAASQLNGERINATLSTYYYSLPLASEDRNANLDNWRNAIEQWYDQNVSSVDYRQHALEQADAILEVGIDTYRIFNVQTSLQVMLKLVDPNTRQVIGRISAKTLSAEDAPQSLLSHEAEKFKQLVADMGAELITQELTDLGLPLKASVQTAATR